MCVFQSIFDVGWMIFLFNDESCREDDFMIKWNCLGLTNFAQFFFVYVESTTYNCRSHN